MDDPVSPSPILYLSVTTLWSWMTPTFMGGRLQLRSIENIWSLLAKILSLESSIDYPSYKVCEWL